MEDVNSLDLLGEAMEHGLATAQKVGLQDHRHALAEEGTSCYLTASVPEEKVSNSLALESERKEVILDRGEAPETFYQPRDDSLQFGCALKDAGRLTPRALRMR